jgi:hypothetical protein
LLSAVHRLLLPHRRELRHDGALNIAVDAICAEPVDEAVSAEDGEHVRLHARETQRCTVALQQLVDRGQLLGAL